MTSKLSASATSKETIALRAKLESLPLVDLVAALKKLDQASKVGLNLNISNNSLLTHQVLHRYLNGVAPKFNREPESELLLVEMLSAMDVDEFNIYDLKDFAGRAALDGVISSATTLNGYRDDFFGSQLITHIVQRATPVDYSDGKITELNPLLSATWLADIAMFKLLINLGFPLTFRVENEIGAKKDSQPEFYQNYRAFMLERAHQSKVTSGKPSRPAL